MIAVVAALGGFGCICNVGARARCGGEEDPGLFVPTDAEPSDAGDPDSGD